MTRREPGVRYVHAEDSQPGMVIRSRHHEGEVSALDRGVGIGPVTVHFRDGFREATYAATLVAVIRDR